jgi:hypothetical protein
MREQRGNNKGTLGLVSVRRGLADRGGGPADDGAGLAAAPQTNNGVGVC